MSRLSPPTVSTRMAKRIVKLLDDRGVDGARLCADAGLDAGILRDPDRRVPIDVVHDAIERAVVATGDADFGLHLASVRDLETYDVAGLVLMASPTRCVRGSSGC